MFFYDASMNLIEQLSRRRDTRGVEILSFLPFFIIFAKKNINGIVVIKIDRG